MNPSPSGLKGKQQMSELRRNSWEACWAHLAHRRAREQAPGEREQQLIHGGVNGKERGYNYVHDFLKLYNHGFYFPVKAL